MKPLSRFLPHAVLALLILVGAIVAFYFQFGTPVSRKGLASLVVKDRSNLEPATVSVDGAIISSSEAVYGVEQHRAGHRVLIVVRAGLVTSGRKNGRFHCEVPLAGGVDEIAFGESSEIIWRH